MAGALLLIVFALATGLLLDDPAEWVADRIAPVPILVLAVLTLGLMIVARLRGGPAPEPFSSPSQRFFWVARFAFATAAAVLLLIWFGPWIAGLKIARELFQGVLLVIVTGVVLGLVGSCLANLLRIIMGARRDSPSAS
jgi:drug/metabolite transporter (DMT)-like permease